MNRFIVLLVFSLLFACSTGNKQNAIDQKADISELVEVTFKVEGMHCTNCENSIAKGVNELEGIEVVKANHVDSTTYVKFDAKKTDEDEIIQQIIKRGYNVKGKI